MKKGLLKIPALCFITVLLYACSSDSADEKLTFALSPQLTNGTTALQQDIEVEVYIEEESDKHINIFHKEDIDHTYYFDTAIYLNNTKEHIAKIWLGGPQDKNKHYNIYAFESDSPHTGGNLYNLDESNAVCLTVFRKK